MSTLLQRFSSHRQFSDRHIGPTPAELDAMCKTLGVASTEDLADKAVPRSIRLQRPLELKGALTEAGALSELRSIAQKNRMWRTYIGAGYYGTIVPPVIQRNILENPGWYTQYTPYQAEISQGRLEALLNFQTMITELTGLPVSNASLLDEATAAAEAMAMSYSARPNQESNKFFISDQCHPQVIDVTRSRANPLEIEIEIGDAETFKPSSNYFGALLSYPCSDGRLINYRERIKAFKEHGLLVTLAADILGLVILESPGALGADIAIGTTQRFGVPFGFGGPHAAYIATKEEHKRRIPGRLVGVSKDKEGRNAIRLALQTREQHIRREKATSNICTAQVLLAIMSSMYACYHGPDGLKEIAERVHAGATLFAAGLRGKFKLCSNYFFDTVTVLVDESEKEKILRRSASREINLRVDVKGQISVSFDETVNTEDLKNLFQVFDVNDEISSFASVDNDSIFPDLRRSNVALSHPIFRRHKSETDLMRYISSLQAKDLSLTTSMIPLGSCTMKLNAAAELFPITWPEFAGIHPFAPVQQAKGYAQLIVNLEQWLCEITGFNAISLQPNSGSQGEYAGLLTIKAYLEAKGEAHRKTCLIPQSAHGTNPASAAMAGMNIIVVNCDRDGNIDIADLQRKAEENSKNLACLMVTYPSTHGVFEEGIREVCDIIHRHGGQVYMDGANMNAQVGLCRPGDFGPDVCHLNLHKTFCIPHGGGGPGMGPIGVAKHLAPFLPGHVMSENHKSGSGSWSVSAAQWGSASILPISWMYIRMMGPGGLRKATETAILNANYIAKRLDPHFPVLYKGQNGWVAHECIVDVRPFKQDSGIEVEDIAKRLMDYGFHAPTVSFPVPGTLMIEPTESESKAELDRFCEAMISIRQEIHKISTGQWDKVNNPLKNAPHTASAVMSDAWDRPYSREVAAYPAPWLSERKFWPSVARIDNAFGDRNLICTCPDISSYT